MSLSVPRAPWEGGTAVPKQGAQGMVYMRVAWHHRQSMLVRTGMSRRMTLLCRTDPVGYAFRPGLFVAGGCVGPCDWLQAGFRRGAGIGGIEAFPWAHRAVL